jgi:hypothetical protein
MEEHAMKFGKSVGLLVWWAALCASASAAVVVGEYSGRYSRPGDYDWQAVGDTAVIEIYTASIPGAPYDFSCYDDVTAEPAVIRSLTADPDVGNLYVRVSPHDGRQYGASDVWLLQIQQEGSLTGVLEDFQIGGNVGEH